MDEKELRRGNAVRASAHPAHGSGSCQAGDVLLPPAWPPGLPAVVPGCSTHPSFVGAVYALGRERRALLPASPLPVGRHLFTPLPACKSHLQLHLFGSGWDFYFFPLPKGQSLHPTLNGGCRIRPGALSHPWAPAQGMLPAALAATAFARLQNSNPRNRAFNLPLM